MEKKTWVMPELIVLVRSKPEETVLSTCKYNPITGPSSYNNGCSILNPCTPDSWCFTGAIS